MLYLLLIVFVVVVVDDSVIGGAVTVLPLWLSMLPLLSLPIARSGPRKPGGTPDAGGQSKTATSTTTRQATANFVMDSLLAANVSGRFTLPIAVPAQTFSDLIVLSAPRGSARPKPVNPPNRGLYYHNRPFACNRRHRLHPGVYRCSSGAAKEGRERGC